jgi:hypothetical protein
VTLLRQITVLPICIEELDYDDVKDTLTLGTALDTLRAIKNTHGLARQDEARLELYEKWSSTKPRSTVIGVKQKTFTLVQDNIRVKDLLDQITALDTAYRWRNDGDNEAPLIVIEPRQRSVLDWPVPRICGPPQELSSSSLYGPGGRLTTLFQAHNISRLEINGRGKLPDVHLDLCRDQLVARDVLNLTVKASAERLSWSLSGIRGMRFLRF